MSVATGKPPPHTYTLAKIAGNVYASVDVQGLACIIFIVNQLGLVGRRYQGIELRFSGGCTVRKGSRTEAVNAAILHCRDPVFQKQFDAVREAVAVAIQRDGVNLGSSDAVVSFVDTYARAFQTLKESLTREAELGLWGELQFLLHIRNTDRGVEAWTGPSKFLVDFSRNGIDVEVKTSTFAHMHHIQHTQTLPPPAPKTQRYLLSVAAEVDPASGVGVTALANQVRSRTKNKLALDAKLAEYGYDHGAAERYQGLWTLVRMRLIRQEDLPRLPAMPHEISDVDYMLDAFGLPASSVKELRAVCARLGD